MDTSSLMEQILSKDNLNTAYLQVVRNKGAEGVDGMKYTELKEHLAKNGEIIKELLWSSIFVTLMANKIGGLQFGIYRNCQISSRVFHTAVAALPLTKANRSDFE